MEDRTTVGRSHVLLGRRRTKLVVPVVGAVVAAAVAAGIAFAKTAPPRVGRGVVVIDTNLANGAGQAAGTGMVLTSSGEVLTNNHVIRGASTIRIVVPGTGRSYAATVVGYDVSDDVAVLKARGASNLKTLSFASSKTVTVGQSVRALGNAGGTGSLSSATGRVTGLARSISVSDDAGGSEHLSGLIETNAALQAGDSGGPLLNAAGRVIGMDTAASVAGGSGFGYAASADGYAIPINKALTIARRIEDGQASAAIHIGATAFFGIEVTADEYGDSGAMVADVVSGSPAAAAGLEPGDLITAIGGRAVSSPATLGSAVAARKPGTRVSVSYVDQSGWSHTATVTLTSGPPR